MSRYTRPGQTVSCFIDYPAKWGTAIVLATSRHKVTCSEDEATRRLTEMYAADGATVEFERITWRSVTRSDLDMIEADEGGFHSDGSGSAWMEAMCAYPTYSDAPP